MSSCATSSCVLPLDVHHGFYLSVPTFTSSSSSRRRRRVRVTAVRHAQRQALEMEVFVGSHGNDLRDRMKLVLRLFLTCVDLQNMMFKWSFRVDSR